MPLLSCDCAHAGGRSRHLLHHVIVCTNQLPLRPRPQLSVCCLQLCSTTSTKYFSIFCTLFQEVDLFLTSFILKRRCWTPSALIAGGVRLRKRLSNRLLSGGASLNLLVFMVTRDVTPKLVSADLLTAASCLMRRFRIVQLVCVKCFYVLCIPVARHNARIF